MEFSRIGEDLEIRLFARDLERLQISYETFDYRDPQQKKLLSDLLGAAHAVTGFSADHQDLNVHLYPRRDGGMCFRIRPRTGASRGALYRFSGFDDLACARKSGLFSGLGGKLWRRGDVFYVLLDEECGALSDYASPLKGKYIKHRVLKQAVRCDGDWLFGKGEYADRTQTDLRGVHPLPSARDPEQGRLRTGE